MPTARVCLASTLCRMSTAVTPSEVEESGSAVGQGDRTVTPITPFGKILRLCAIRPYREGVVTLATPARPRTRLPAPPVVGIMTRPYASEPRVRTCSLLGFKDAPPFTTSVTL